MVEVLVTGGAGFIGSNFVRYALEQHLDWHVTTFDKLTYAGRRENLHDVLEHPRHTLVHGDIADAPAAGPLVERADIVVHFAAETHVDRSILAAGDFIQTDVVGTFVLLEAARRATQLKRFVQISTDEVYGSVPSGASRETDELKPRNPYSASKAAADRLAYSYWATYNVPVVITRASNNYGPYQFPEKVIPLFVTNAIDSIAVPLYGDGRNIRDWLHVVDHCRAIDLLIEDGVNGEVYNIGGGYEIANPPDSGARRAACIADCTGRRPARPRSPLLPRHIQAAGARLAAAGRLRRGPSGDRRVVPPERMVVEADQGSGCRLQGVLRCAVRTQTVMLPRS
jgi:dTDP-glucose 4,6-dehydratase